MRKSMVLTLSVPLLALSACYGGYYGGGVGVGYDGGGYYGTPYAYNGYYDGFYGPIYDGYWGRDNYFYYRRGAGDRAFIRGDRNHFAREARGGNYREMRGQFTPQRGYRTPNFPGRGRGGGGGGGHDRGGHDHDRH